MDGGLQRDHLETIAYCALWQLRELDPGREPGYFKMTRLALHDRLSHEGQGACDAAPLAHLKVVPS